MTRPPMTRAQINALCASLPGATHVVRWGGADVWKVGGKIFAVVGWDDGDPERPSVSFKAGEIAFDALLSPPGVIPAPYLASRGLKWLQDRGGLGPEALAGELRASWSRVAAGLPKKARAALGLA